MKNFLLTIITVITVTINANAQITYIGEIEGIHNPIFYKENQDIKINVNNNKLVARGNSSDEYTIYNLINFNLEKIVKVDRSNMRGCEGCGSFIETSVKLFNIDDKIEFFYSYLTNNGVRYVVMNEDGLILFDKTYNYTERNPVIFENNKTIYLMIYDLVADKYKSEFYKLGGVPCDNCSSTSLSKNNLKGNNISVNLFPNPTSSILNIAFEGDNSDVQYEIYAVNGNIVNSGYIMGENTSVDVSTLASGSYVCKLTNKNGFLYSSLFIKN